MKEAYLWDLGVDSSRLTALLSYTISPGGTDSLAVRLPVELEALSVEARRPQDGTKVRLRDWNVAGNGAGRTLTCELPAPVEWGNRRDAGAGAAGAVAGLVQSCRCRRRSCRRRPRATRPAGRGLRTSPTGRTG